MAEDHINFTIGRQSFTLGEPENALLAFRQILTNESRQIAAQQAAFLREYLYVSKVTTSTQPLLPCVTHLSLKQYSPLGFSRIHSVDGKKPPGYQS